MIADVDFEKMFQLALDKIADRNLKSEAVAAAEQIKSADLPAQAVEEDKGAPQEPETSKALGLQIREMSIPQRIKLAMFGNQTARAILLRDSNRLIPFFVLENPRLTDNEIFEISKNTQVDENILRAVGNNMQWMKSYAVKYALVSNPKAPIDVTIRWLKFIKDKDLTRLAKSKGIPHVVANQARKLAEKRSPEG